MIFAVLSLMFAAETQGARDRPDPDPRAYRAIGTEPFWSVTITDDEIIYDDVEERRTAVGKPRPQTVRGNLIYRTRSLSVVIRNQECSDGMSDRRYADTVMVKIGRQRLSGCGRAYPDARSLDGSEWRIVRVNGAPVQSQRPATIAFAEDQVSGSTGCNRFMGSYTLDAGRLSAPRLATTRMACVGAGMEVERALLDLLSAPVVAYPMRNGSIRLVGTEKRSADLVRVE